MRLLRVALAAALALAAAPTLPACRSDERAPVAAREAALTTLDARHDPLRARFDQEAERPRLLVMASPT